MSGVITKRRLVGLALGLLLLAGLQGMCLSLKVKEVEPRVYGRLAGPTVGPRRRLVFASSAWMVGWTLFSLPLLMWGYGQPLYSDWLGPGADVWSTGGSIASGSGLTVSYRPLLEALALPPLL